MQNVARHTGQCFYKEFKMEFQILNLEFIKGKNLYIEAICYHPTSAKNKEVLFQYNTSNTESCSPLDEKSAIALMIINLTIDKLKLNKNNLYKLSIKNKDVYHISKV